MFAYWVDAVAKIRWSFATELRDGGIFGTWATPLPCSTYKTPLLTGSLDASVNTRTGFLLPPAQIRPSGEEMSAALRRLTQFILDVRSLLFLFGVRFIWS